MKENKLDIKTTKKITFKEDEIILIGKHNYKGEEVELIAFNYPSRANTYDMKSGYIFRNNQKGIEYESLCNEHLISNLLTHESVEDATNIFNLFKEEWGGNVISVSDVIRMKQN